nr:probable methionine--tRNA ligase [Ipomoea batatas]
MASNRKQLIATALCKELSLDPKQFLRNPEIDIKSLCIEIISSTPSGAALLKDNEFMKWVEFADKFPGDSEPCFKALSELNEELVKMSVLLGNGFVHSAADVIVFSTVHSSVIGLSKLDQDKLPHLLRWVDYIQNKADVTNLFDRIKLEKVEFDPPVSKPSIVHTGEFSVEKLSAILLYGNLELHSLRVDTKLNAGNWVASKSFFLNKGSLKLIFHTRVVKVVKKAEVDSNVKNPEQGKKESGSAENVKPKKSAEDVKPKKSAEDVKPKKNADAKKAAGGNQTTTDNKNNKKVPEKEVDEKDKDISVSLLKVQIGHIRKAWKHPSADSLLVEEIDVGEAKCRQVVSGLAKYFTPEQMTNRLVVLITNMKPSKLRDVTSEGMVLCASNDDHTVVEPLIAPEGAKVGECVSFSGHDGKPEDVLNPKKKQFDKIAVSKLHFVGKVLVSWSSAVCLYSTVMGYEWRSLKIYAEMPLIRFVFEISKIMTAIRISMVHCAMQIVKSNRISTRIRTLDHFLRLSSS